LKVAVPATAKRVVWGCVVCIALVCIVSLIRFLTRRGKICKLLRNSVYSLNFAILRRNSEWLKGKRLLKL
jgi:hypothetical protein